MKSAKDFALQRFAKDLLDSVDNFDRALENVPKEKLNKDQNPDLVNLHSGLKMTEEILMKTLERHGMKRVDPSIEGEVFNPNEHEATFQAPQPDKKDGTVFFTQQKGFIYNGRVLRVSHLSMGPYDVALTDLFNSLPRSELSRTHSGIELAITVAYL